MIKKIIINGEIELGANQNYTLRKGVVGLEMGVLSNEDSDIPQSHHSRRVSNFMHSRVISLPISVKGLTTAQLLENRRRLSKSVYQRQGQKQTIVITDLADQTYYTEGTLESLSLPADYNHISKGSLIMKTDYMPLLGTSIHTQEVGVLGQGGGVILPVEIPLTLPLGQGSQTLVNNGTFVTIPDLVITGPGTNFTVRNISTGEAFRLGYAGNDFTLLTGQTVNVLGLQFSISQAGTNKYEFFDQSGEFLTLDPGNNELSLEVESGSDSNTKVQVQWRDAFLGI